MMSLYAFYLMYFKPDEPKRLAERKYQKYKLIEKENVSHNTRRFRFALQSPTTELGLPCGKNISFRFFKTDASTNETDEIRRPYTPITSNREKGYFDMMIKVYADGEMTSYLDTLRVHRDCIEARGPMGNVHYAAPGRFEVKQKREVNAYAVTKIGMVCGGTGITPMLQIINEVAVNARDKTEISLIFGNVSMDDILMKSQLEAIRKKHENIHIRFIIDKAPTDGRVWEEDVGYVTLDLLRQRIFAPAEDVIVLLCGPPIMIKICKANLIKLGHEEKRVVTF